MVFLTGLGNGLGPFRMVDGIGSKLGFQSDAAVLAVGDTILAGFGDVVAGIELDDSTHNKKSAQETDAFKNQVFSDIRVPLYRVKVKAGNNAAYIGEVTQIIKEIVPQNIATIG